MTDKEREKLKEAIEKQKAILEKLKGVKKE